MNKQDLLLLGTKTNYIKEDRDVIDTTITYYQIANFDSMVYDLDIPQAIQNFNTNLGTESGVTVTNVREYLAAAIDYHSMVMFYKKNYDRMNRTLGNKTAKWSELQVLQPDATGSFNYSDFADDLDKVRDIQLNNLNPQVMSNARWSREVLSNYNLIYLPGTIYLLASYLFSNVFKTSNNSKLYEIIPADINSSITDVTSVLGSLVSDIKDTISTSPFFTEFLKFIGFSNITTDDYVLDANGSSINYLIDADMDFAIINSAYNDVIDDKLIIQFQTNNVLYEGVNDSHLNIDLPSLSNILLFIKTKLVLNGVAAMMDGEWLSKSFFNHEFSTEEVYRALVVTKSTRPWINDARIFDALDFRDWLVGRNMKSDFFALTAHDYLFVKRPLWQIAMLPDEIHAEVKVNFTQPVLAEEHTVVYGNNEQYVFNVEMNVIMKTLVNLIFYGYDQYPTVYIPRTYINKSE